MSASRSFRIIERLLVVRYLLLPPAHDLANAALPDLLPVLDTVPITFANAVRIDRPQTDTSLVLLHTQDNALPIAPTGISFAHPANRWDGFLLAGDLGAFKLASSTTTNAGRSCFAYVHFRRLVPFPLNFAASPDSAVLSYICFRMLFIKYMTSTRPAYLADSLWGTDCLM